MAYVILPFVGFFIGLLIIALGGGGGGFYVGILTAFFNIPPAVAAATSLATIIPTTAIGAVSHWRAGNVNLKLGVIMLTGAVLGSIVGSLFSDYVPEKLYNKITGVLLLILAFEMLLAWLKKSKKTSRGRRIQNPKYLGYSKSFNLRNCWRCNVRTCRIKRNDTDCCRTCSIRL